MRWSEAAMAAIFDGDKGEVFTVLLVALLVAGAVLLVVNLTSRPRPPPAPPAPSWEPVPEGPGGASAPAPAATTATVRPPQRRRPQ